jgi:ribosomal-protein-alanine N-acetyltransferase
VLLSESIFRDLPELRTERLLLRKFTLDDAADMFEIASDPEVARLVPWDMARSINDTRQSLQSMVDSYRAGRVMPWAVVLVNTGKLIGSCGYYWWMVNHDRAEMGYVLARPYWNQGLMTEAGQAVIRFGFRVMGLHRVEARCLLDNSASEKVLLKLGMTFEGIQREALYAAGKYHTLKVFALLNPDPAGPRIGPA